MSSSRSDVAVLEQLDKSGISGFVINFTKRLNVNSAYKLNLTFTTAFEKGGSMNDYKSRGMLRLSINTVGASTK